MKPPSPMEESTVKHLNRVPLQLVSILLLTVLLGCPPADDDVSIPEPLDWSKVVGADYVHREACQQTIDEYLKLDEPGYAGLLEPPVGVSFAGLPVPPNDADNLACAWDVFAWNSFAALNWPANTELGKRGLSSSSHKFLDPVDPGTEVVWESFKEKRELFQDDPSKDWNDIEDGQEVKSFQKPKNLWDQNSGYCTKQDKERAGTAASGPFAANKFHNQLDETAEVQSQALESLDLLCQGYGSDCAINNESVVGPRVWMGTATTGRPLYYEVKVNYDFFDYVMNPPKGSNGMALPNPDATLVDDEVAATNAMLNNIRLPWRTTLPTEENPNNQKAVFEYGPVSCNPTVGTPEDGVEDGSVPCKAGAVHMKAAWVLLTEDEITTDPPRYHTTTALYYKTPEEGKTCIAVDTFGLLGLHAIQRVMVGGAEYPQNPGGAFIFATWEHRSILDSSYPYPQGFQYVNLLTNPAFGMTTAGDPYPKLEYALDVTRMIPTDGNPQAETTCGLSAEQTCQVNESAISVLEESGSVWANYRLVGTQFAPNDCTFMDGSPADYQLASCRYNTLDNLGQPHFLANAVIETNQGLQHFLGLPPQQPRLQPYKWCASADGLCDNQGGRLIGPNTKQNNDGSVFDRGAPNMTYGKNAINMGGCQGCHGVAQQNGYSFSFVLLDGVGGAKPDTEQDADIPATAIAQSVPVRLKLVTDTSKYLAIGQKQKGSDFYELKLSDQSEAATWRLRPYTSNPNIGNFAGEIVLTEIGNKGILLLGQGGGGVGPVVGNKNSALVGPPLSGGISRAPSSQSVYLVKYTKGVAGATYPYSFVSVAETADSNNQHYLLSADPSSGAVSAQAPGSTEVLQQVFNIEIVSSQ